MGKVLKAMNMSKLLKDEWVRPSKCILDKLGGRDQIGLGPDKTSQRESPDALQLQPMTIGWGVKFTALC